MPKFNVKKRVNFSTDSLVIFKQKLRGYLNSRKISTHDSIAEAIESDGFNKEKTDFLGECYLSKNKTIGIAKKKNIKSKIFNILRKIEEANLIETEETRAFVEAKNKKGEHNGFFPYPLYRGLDIPNINIYSIFLSNKYPLIVKVHNPKSGNKGFNCILVSPLENAAFENKMEIIENMEGIK